MFDFHISTYSELYGFLLHSPHRGIFWFFLFVICLGVLRPHSEQRGSEVTVIGSRLSPHIFMENLVSCHPAINKTG